MPNWVKTCIDFEGTQSNIDKVFERIKRLNGNTKYNAFDFNRLIPTEAPPNDGDWNNWHCHHWGTKWNACASQRIGKTTLQFQTAWSWPKPIMQKLAEICNGHNVTFTGRWSDESVGSNTGEFWTIGDGLFYHCLDDGSSEAIKAYVDCWGGRVNA